LLGSPCIALSRLRRVASGGAGTFMSLPLTRASLVLAYSIKRNGFCWFHLKIIGELGDE